MSKIKAIAYVDGSFNPHTVIAGSSVILIISEQSRPHRFAYQRNVKAMRSYGANLAEMNAVKTAIKLAHSLGVSELHIYHDWNGVEHFSHRENVKAWHEQCFSQYADYVERHRKHMRIRFVKVKAHSGVELNVLADKMAKAGKVV